MVIQYQTELFRIKVEVKTLIHSYANRTKLESASRRLLIFERALSSRGGITREIRIGQAGQFAGAVSEVFHRRANAIQH